MKKKLCSFILIDLYFIMMRLLEKTLFVISLFFMHVVPLNNY